MDIIDILKKIGLIIQSKVAIISACAAILGAYAAYKSYRLKIPAYAIISKDGDILEKGNFGKFGICVNKEKGQREYGHCSVIVYINLITHQIILRFLHKLLLLETLSN